MLKIKNVVAGYGKAEVLHGIELYVDAGEVVALVGPNGAGKTTTIRCVTGQLPIKQGLVTYKEKDISQIPAYQIVNLGICCSPEGRNVFGNLSVYENLKMGGYLIHGKQLYKEQLEWVYSLFPKLWERRDQLAESLSGGEQQMLAIGRAIMSKPSLLLLDEPSLGLAPVVVDQIYEKIEEISHEGTSILLVEQNVRLALEISSRAYVMESGQIRLCGKSSELEKDSYIEQTYLGVK
ncbi:MAG: ABC transporter ATP-binding protein [Aminobacterium sp.]|uniref:ABC transporter ATP-binding protein n=1 Tax=Aminobacterium sp. TaxID=1872491 RepID=UPI002B20A568|nr:ABC transporter ATP-binding protein [Aminobacterium sp.]MEA4877872.1 ABC transporter ATP-binding protein [Aminobacterium sp.]